MDKLLSLLHRCPSNISALEVINILEKHCQDQIKIVHYSASSMLYSSTVVIGNGKSFVASDRYETIAKEKVSKMALDYLKATNNIENCSKDNALFIDFNNTETNLTVANVLSSDSGCDVESGIESLLIEDNADMSNHKVTRFLKNLKSRGFLVEIMHRNLFDPITFEITFKVTISIPKIGQFTEFSSKSKCESLRMAALKLISHLRNASPELLSNDHLLSDGCKDFENENQQTPIKCNQNENQKTILPRNGNISTAKDFCEKSSTNLKQICNYKDYRKIVFLNQFISVYNLDKSPVNMIKALINIDPTVFNFVTKTSQANNLNQPLYSTCLTVRDFISSTGSSYDKQNSCNHAMQIAFEKLKIIVSFFVAFKLIYSDDKSPSVIVDQLIDRNDGMIRMSTIKYVMCTKVSASITHWTAFSGSKSSESEARLFICTKMVNYLRSLTEKLCLGPNNKFEEEIQNCSRYKMKCKSNYLLDNDEKSLISGVDCKHNLHSFEKEMKTDSGLWQEIGLDLSKKESKITPNLLKHESIQSKHSNHDLFALHMDTLFYKRIDLINRFNSVYPFVASSDEIIKALNGSLFLNEGSVYITVKTEATFDGTTFITKVKIEDISAEFIAYSDTEKESEKIAIQKAVEYLKNLAKLISNFKSIFHPTKLPLKIMDQLIAGNQEIIKVNFSKNRDISNIDKQYLTVIQLVNMCSFAKTAATEFDSKKEAMVCAFDYLHRLSNSVK